MEQIKLPALPVALGWIAGILLWTSGCPWYGAVVAALVGMSFLIFRKQYPAFLFYAVGCGWLISYFNAPTSAPEVVFESHKLYYSAVVKDVVNTPNGQTLFITIDSLGTSPERLTAVDPFVVKASELPDWEMTVGTRLKIHAELEPVDDYNSFPHDRDMSLYNLRHGIAAQTYIQDSDMERTGTENSPARWFDQRREAILSILAHSSLSDEAYGIISAITVGYGDDLDSDIRENFQSSGLAHTLALSGFHVGVIAIMVSLLLYPMRAFYRLRRLRLLLSLAAIWFYAAMVGMPDSVVRAVVMLSIFTFGKILKANVNPLNTLCATVAIILAFSPFSLYSAGFQLSVCAVGGILLLSDRLNPFERKNHRAYQLMSLLTVPTAAVIGTLPVTIIYFHRLPLLFALSNIAIFFIFPLLMFGGIAVIIAGAVGLGDSLLCAGVNFLVRIVDAIAEGIAGLSFSVWDNIYLNGWQIGALIIGLTALIVLMYYPRKYILAASAGVLVGCSAVMVMAKDKMAATEAFVVNQSANTPIIMREGTAVKAIFTCHPRNKENARRKLAERMRDYMYSCGVDSITVVEGDFDFGHFKRRGNVLVAGDKTIGLAVEPGKLTGGKGTVNRTDYAIVSSRFRGKASDIERVFNPDTIIFSRDLSIKRAAQLREETTRPIIDLRYSTFSLF